METSVSIQKVEGGYILEVCGDKGVGGPTTSIHLFLKDVLAKIEKLLV